MNIRTLCIMVGAMLFGVAPVSAQESGIPVLAHYVSWHAKCPNNVPACDAWKMASTIPLRTDGIAGIGYAASDPAIIAAHNAEMREHGILPLISWWGPDVPAGDAFLNSYLAVKDPLRIALLYEAGGRLTGSQEFNFDTPANRARFVADMKHFQDTYWSKYPERFLKIDGRPVVFIWNTNLFVGAFDLAVREARAHASFFLVGSEVNVPMGPRAGLARIVKEMDAISSYGLYNLDFAKKYDGHMNRDYASAYFKALTDWSAWLVAYAPATKLFVPLMFSYDDTKVPGRSSIPITSTPTEMELMARVARLAVEVSAAGCGNVLPFVLFVSYNEHYEGSSAEPSDRYGFNVLEILSSVFRPPPRTVACR
jgi:hypothetical protein